MKVRKTLEQLQKEPNNKNLVQAEEEYRSLELLCIAFATLSVVLLVMMVFILSFTQ
jgi:hypothetical protein